MHCTDGENIIFVSPRDNAAHTFIGWRRELIQARRCASSPKSAYIHFNVPPWQLREDVNT